MHLTEIEKDILEILAQDARRTPAQIALMLGAEVSKVQEAIKELEDARVVVAYPALINWDKSQAESVEAVIEVRVTPMKGYGFDAIAEQIMEFPEVENVYLMSGAYDLLLFVRAKTLKELAMFVAERLAPIENVISTATHFMLKRYKISGITMDKHEDKRQAVSQ
ncbi:MAG: Lrp/AsnC family transcriptional regulator [Clostridiales bacterium]|nr:Lrp/AsnC family transcriptional regulator [Clostridiales bacterium]MBQ2817607.1 Lrp/AsnC family transcriptional regulator [Clostridia bacterium]MBQ4638202.1 Lrp/AsnC family transcriptional regulator [Clostridia bacterium]